MRLFLLTMLLVVSSFGQDRDVVRNYHGITVDKMAATPPGRYVPTHVRVIGRACLVKTEDDGDRHIKLCGTGKSFIVAECIPLLPCVAPKVGQKVEVRGISRYDSQHRWWEIHPVELISLTVVPRIDLTK